MNVVDYVKKYGDIKFKDKSFNEIDNIVFSSLAYIDFDERLVNGKNTLEYLGKEYLNRKIKVKNLILAKKDAYELLKVIVDKKRYKDIKIKNYVYKARDDMQFKAMTFVISNNLNYIAFEGTDELISGWIEDFKLSYMFPIPSQELAINYVNENVRLLGPKIIIGGHSKGGNLALVAAMYMKKLKKLKLSLVYNNDGPGLKDEQFKTFEYESIKSKYIHIIPHSSIVGILLNDSKYCVIKSKKNSAIGHSINTWLIGDEKLIRANLSKRSINMKKNIEKWQKKHSEEEIKYMIEDLYNALKKSDINEINNIKNVRKVISFIKKLKRVDKNTKTLLKELLINGYIGISSKE